MASLCTFFTQRNCFTISLIIGISSLVIIMQILENQVYSTESGSRNILKVGDVMGFDDGQEICAMYSNAYRNMITPDVPSNFSHWTYKQKRKCPKFDIPTNFTNVKRVKYHLKCSNNKPKLVSYFANRSDDIQVVQLKDPCLAAFTNICCNDGRGIPNIVHYVWYFQREMDFSMFLSMMGAIRFVRPCLILIHGEYLPYGKYWDYIVSIYPAFLHIKTQRPSNIFGKKVIYHEHSGDFMRLEALVELGGIYFDHDTIALRDLEPLREYSISLCNQSDNHLLNSFIITKKTSTFLSLWIDGYRNDFRNRDYGYNSMKYNGRLAHERKDLINIEQGTLCPPSEKFKKESTSDYVYDWSKLYGIHLFSRVFRFAWNENAIKSLRSAFGAMARHIIYGNKELCE